VGGVGQGIHTAGGGGEEEQEEEQEEEEEEEQREQKKEREEEAREGDVHTLRTRLGRSLVFLFFSR
jgi:serine/threonine protein kinase HipA of HipAB toxin-antitoxin module